MSDECLDLLFFAANSLADAARKLQVNFLFLPPYLEKQVDEAVATINALAKAGAVQLPGGDGDGLALDLRLAAKRIADLADADQDKRRAHRDELRRLAQTLAERRDALSALRGFSRAMALDRGTSSTPPAPASEAPPPTGAPALGVPLAAGAGPTDPFTEFIRHQRTLLLTLWNKGKVPIEVVRKSVYGTSSDKKNDALLQLIKRTNKRLTEAKMEPRYEVKRRGNFMELRQV